MSGSRPWQEPGWLKKVVGRARDDVEGSSASPVQVNAEARVTMKLRSVAIKAQASASCQQRSGHRPLSGKELDSVEVALGEHHLSDSRGNGAKGEWRALAWRAVAWGPHLPVKV